MQAIRLPRGNMSCRSHISYRSGIHQSDLKDLDHALWEWMICPLCAIFIILGFWVWHRAPPREYHRCRNTGAPHRSISYIPPRKKNLSRVTVWFRERIKHHVNQQQKSKGHLVCPVVFAMVSDKAMLAPERLVVRQTPLPRQTFGLNRSRGRHLSIHMVPVFFFRVVFVSAM